MFQLVASRWNQTQFNNLAIGIINWPKTALVMDQSWQKKKKTENFDSLYFVLKPFRLG